jgi:hypothetical protein
MIFRKDIPMYPLDLAHLASSITLLRARQRASYRPGPQVHDHGE